ncbi:hypothetical protein BH09ACT10_BH09ACT10_18060 [soil metagenome]
MAIVFTCTKDDSFDEALDAAKDALTLGDLVVMPTDTVYGLAADAFSGKAVQKLLSAKGRTRQMPPPVLVSAPTTIDALATDIPAWVRDMIAELWPGPLTVICHQQPSLDWDLGETRGTVAIRMPDDPIALQLLKQTGPLAVSSANLTGQPAALTVADAQTMLGDSVAVYLDGGPSTLGEPSTIVDVTGATVRVLRQGVVDLATLHRFNNTIVPASGGHD